MQPRIEKAGGQIPVSAQAVLRIMDPPILMGALFLIIYLSTLTADYFWDGITFALQIEKVADGERSAALLFHQSHLLYNALGYLLYRAVNAVGVPLRALWILQGANVIFSATALGVYFSVARRMTRSLYAATASTALLAVFATWWKLATDADAYIPSVLLMLLCLRALIATKPSWILAGLSLAGAMLMHELASLFSFAAVAIVFSSQTVSSKKRFALRLLALAWAISIAAYYACAAALHGITDPLGVIKWATTNPSRIVPFTSPLPGLRQSPRANVDLVVGHSFSLFRAQAGAVGWLIALAAGATLIILIWRIGRELARRRHYNWRELVMMIRERLHPRLLILTAWVMPYVLFLWFFEPEDAHLRLFYAPALALGVATWLGHSQAAAADSSSRKPSHFLRTSALAIVALGSFNLAFYILPHADVNASPLIQKARGARADWDGQTVVFYLDHSEIDTAFEYFNRRSRWQRLSLEKYPDFNERIRATLARGEHVWLNDRAMAALSPEQLAEFALGDEIDVDLDYGGARYVELLPPP
jgi:hypothetical protein